MSLTGKDYKIGAPAVRRAPYKAPSLEKSLDLPLKEVSKFIQEHARIGVQFERGHGPTRCQKCGLAQLSLAHRPDIASPNIDQDGRARPKYVLLCSSCYRKMPPVTKSLIVRDRVIAEKTAIRDSK